MPVPYTIEAVGIIRQQIAARVPIVAIQHSFGWDTDMLQRICRKHGIDVHVPQMPVAPKRATIEPVDIADVISKLEPRQKELFGILHPLTNGRYVRSVVLAERIGAPCRESVIGWMRKLRDRLIQMKSPHQVQVKQTRGGGYRLVIDESRL